MEQVVKLATEVVIMVQSHRLVHKEGKMVIQMDHMVDQAQEARVMEEALTLMVVRTAKVTKEDNKCLEALKTRATKAVAKVLGSNLQAVDFLQVSSTK